MRVGLQLPSFSFAGGTAAIRPRLLEIAQAAEAQGLASLWVMDHLFQLPEDSGWGGPDEPMLEAYTTLGFLAAGTERIRLGALVGCAMYRSPGLLLKAVTTLDVLSAGRAYFGIGAGWYAREAHGLGLPFPSRRERFEHLEETLQLAHQLWSDDRRPHRGRHHELVEPILVPQPLSRPHPPIMIGGGGERRTLRLVARYGDACNILVPDPGESRHKLEVLRRHCEEIGRPYGAIEKTSLIELDLRPGRMSLADARRAIHAQRDEGIEHVIVNLPQVDQLEQLDVLGRAALAEVAA
ncbi:MAG TPA: LLM class F420-dependent oxidoreductase [Candidatus Dormibacteraeota bacterium]|nr:LLM class F420-dependent oxidoreductase [Candidatus Dormibacteraeota bacterium]